MYMYIYMCIYIVIVYIRRHHLGQQAARVYSVPPPLVPPIWTLSHPGVPPGCVCVCVGGGGY